MKNNKISTAWKLTFALGGCVLLNACSDQDLNEQLQQTVMEEGIETEVTLNLTTTPLAQKTRAAISSRADSKIYNLWLYVFDAEGKNGRLFRFQNPQDKVSFKASSGQHLIYALANVDEADDLVTFSNDLSAITDVKTLRSALATLNTMTVFRNNGHLVMSGTYGDDTGLCTIKPVGHVTLPETLWMKRLDARVTFHIGLDPNDPEVSNKRFTATSWQVYNAPTATTLFAADEATEANYFTMSEPLPFEECERVGNDGAEKNSFTFYALENNQKGSGATQWSDREKKAKDPVSGINTAAFENAPQHATYVKISGKFSYDYTDAETGRPAHQNAEVEYTIHLGYLGDDPYNNYECDRNVSYTYNVLVHGVDDIILKVDDDNDDPDDPDDPDSPGDGSDGDVVVARYFFDFDAHYDRSLLQFDKEDIINNHELQGFFVSTPFNEGFYYIDEDNLETPYPGAKPASEAIDYEWIKFRRCDMKSDSIYNNTSYSYYDPNNVINIKQLIKALRTGRDQNGFAVYDRNGKAYYTLFIDENYYTIDPRTGEHGPVDFWKQFVNQDPREMYIFCHCNRTLDLQSSVTKGNIQIRQRSIRTHYDVKAPAALQTAWGVETRNETGQARAEIINPWDANGLTMDNALKNQLIQLNLIGMEWKTLLSTDIGRGDYQNQLNDNSLYSAFVYGCVQRNRDENGNGIIDREELKWIPAATAQYNEMWIGSHSLPNDLRLYPMGSREYHRYLTSSGEEFMAEEGESVMPYGSLRYNGINGEPRPSRYDYRCIRLLGFDTYENDDVMPQSLIQVDEETKTISLQWLDKNSRRSDDFYFGNEVEVASHDSYLNYPYTKFEYMDVTDESEIPEGWRLPNDREMAIMVQCLKDGWGSPTGTTYYKTCTTAPDYITGKVHSFHYGVCTPLEDGTLKLHMELPDANPEARIRCIRDVR